MLRLLLKREEKRWSYNNKTFFRWLFLQSKKQDKFTNFILYRHLFIYVSGYLSNNLLQKKLNS